MLPTVYSGVQVAFTVLFGLTFLDEKLEAIQFAGIAITVVGVYCVARRRADEREEETRPSSSSSSSFATSTADPAGEDEHKRIRKQEHSVVVTAPDAVPHRPSLDQ